MAQSYFVKYGGLVEIETLLFFESSHQVSHLLWSLSHTSVKCHSVQQISEVMLVWTSVCVL